MENWNWTGGLTLGTGAYILSGAGYPEGIVVAPVGSLFLRTDGILNATLYVKESGTGATGWVAIGGSGVILAFTSFTLSTPGPVELGSTVANETVSWSYNMPVAIQTFTSFGGSSSGSVSDTLITSIQIASNLLTVLCNNNYAVGQNIQLSGITSATFLNGQTVLIAFVSPSQFSINYTYSGSYGPTLDTGQAEPQSQFFLGPFTSNQTWTLSGDGVIDSISLNFNLRRFWGVSAGTTVSNSQILAFNNELGFGDDVSGNFNKIVTYDCSVGGGFNYPYYVYPVAWGGPPIGVTVNGLPFSDFSIATQSVTNASGHVDSYYILRFNNVQTGSNILTSWK